MTRAAFAAVWLGLLAACWAAVAGLALVLLLLPPTALAGLLGAGAVVAASVERGRR